MKILIISASTHVRKIDNNLCARKMQKHQNHRQLKGQKSANACCCVDVWSPLSRFVFSQRADQSVKDDRYSPTLVRAYDHTDRYEHHFVSPGIGRDAGTCSCFSLMATTSAPTPGRRLSCDRVRQTRGSGPTLENSGISSPPALTFSDTLTRTVWTT